MEPQQNDPSQSRPEVRPPPFPSNIVRPPINSPSSGPRPPFPNVTGARPALPPRPMMPPPPQGMRAPPPPGVRPQSPSAQQGPAPPVMMRPPHPRPAIPSVHSTPMSQTPLPSTVNFEKNMPQATNSLPRPPLPSIPAGPSIPIFNEGPSGSTGQMPSSVNYPRPPLPQQPIQGNLIPSRPPPMPQMPVIDRSAQSPMPQGPTQFNQMPPRPQMPPPGQVNQTNMSRPPMARMTNNQAPLRPPMPPVSGPPTNQVPLHQQIAQISISQPQQSPTRPPMPQMPSPGQSNQIPGRPPMPQIPFPGQMDSVPVRPLMPMNQNLPRPPLPAHGQEQINQSFPLPSIPRPPMPRMTSPALSSQMPMAMRPPMPMPDQVRPPMPSQNNAPMRPSMPIPGQVNQASHYPPHHNNPLNAPPTIHTNPVINAQSNIPNMHMAQSHMQPQGFSQSQFPQPQQGYAHMAGAPQSVTSSSHNLCELYEPVKSLIQPNIESDYLQCTLGKIPRNTTLLGKARIPFGLTVSFYPYSDSVKDRVAEANGPIVRCRRCRTYINPFVEIIEQGSRWRCNLCYLANEFPAGFDYDPVTQTPIDRASHPELNNYIYDFSNAPVEYTVRPPQPPIYLFALEVTAAAVQSGLLAASCRVIQEQLDSIPNEDSRARVAFVTFDQRMHFYQIRSNEAEARVLVVSDAGEPFLPASSDLLVNLSECRTQIDSLLEQLPSFYTTPSKSSPALGPLLRSAHLLLKSVGGKIIVVAASLPSQFEGALKARDDVQLLGTNKESPLLQPANQFYKLYASEVVKDQIGVDLFIAPPSITTNVPAYMDVASLAGLTKYTGGKLHYYPSFGSSEAITTKFASDLRRFIGQEHGFEAVLRIRASQGISLSAYHGSFFLRQTDLLSLPNVNPDHSFSAQASIDENLLGSVVSFQAALLHTTSRGERRIRVINFSVPVTEDVKEVFTNLNVVAIAGILSKMAVEKVLSNRLEDAREAVLNKCADVIAAFKNISGLKTNPNLLLPENLKNFPIVMHSIIKSTLLRGGKTILPDLRSFHLTLIKSLSSLEIIGFLLPRFYAIHSMDSACGGGVDRKLPNLMNLSSEKLDRHGIFLLDSTLQQFLWVGPNVHPELCKFLFNCDNPAQITAGRVSQLLPELENDWNVRVRGIIEEVRSKYSKNCAAELFIVKEDCDQTIRQQFMTHLIEDRSVDGAAQSYAQWLVEVAGKVTTSSY